MDNNILVISEEEQKAYLPYKYEEIQKIYESPNCKYNSIMEIIQDLYIVPLNKFENFSTARFREAFNLIRYKEKSSIFSALDLGLELMFKYNLNPIIIAACRNLDELDIYLDCLDENELSDFKCFEVRFEVNPNLVNKPIREF